jgi:hypothetical protein
MGDQIDPEKAGIFNIFRMFIDLLENPLKGVSKSSILKALS